jgi:type I restriction enzyme S subunit
LDSQRIPVKEDDRQKRVGSVPYYGANGQVGWIDVALFNEPLLLIAEDGGHFDEPERGVAYTIRGPAWVNNHAHVLRPDEQKVLLDFLGYHFRQFDFLPYITGTTRAKLTQADLMRVEVPVPPLAEQERIVKLLDEADELRKLRAQADRRTAALLPALFHEMFGDPAKNPKSWPMKRVEEIAVNGKRGVTTGPFGTQLGSKDFTREGPEVFGIYSLRDANRFRSGGTKRISPQKFSELARFNVLPDDVLVSRMGTVGKVCVVPNNSPQGIVSYHLIRVRLDREQCDPQFFAQLLSVTEAGGVGISQSAKGAIMSGINAAIVASYRVPVPPLPLQQEFAQRVIEIRALEAGQATSRHRLEALFQSLLHRAFQGEL